MYIVKSDSNTGKNIEKNLEEEKTMPNKNCIKIVLGPENYTPSVKEQKNP